MNRNTAFTRRRPAVLLVATALALGLAGCSSRQERLDAGLKKGAAYLRQADWDKANVELRNVLQIDPKNAAAYVLAGQMAEGQRDLQRAYANFRKAQELQPSLLEAQLGVGRAFLMANDIDQAEATVKTALALEPQNARARALQAAVMLRRGQVDAAFEQAQALRTGAPGAPVEATMLVAGVLVSRGDTRAALAAVEEGLKQAPDDLGLLQIGAQITSGLPPSDPDAARAAGYLERAARSLPRHFDAWRAWAAFLAQRGDPARAEQVLREAADAVPDDTTRRVELLRFIAAQRGLAEGEKAFRAAIADAPRTMALRLALVQLYRAHQRHAEAQQVLADIVDLGQDVQSVIDAKTQLAAYRLAAGRADEARALLADVLKNNPRDNAGLLLQGRMLLRGGQAQDAVVALRPVVRDQPGSAEAVALLAQAHRLAGEPQLAREVLAEAVKFRPEDPELRLLLVADLTDAHELRAAGAEIDTGLKTTPGAVRLVEAKVRLALLQNDVAGAEAALRAFRQRFADQVAPALKLGQFYARTGRPEAALKEYEAAARLAPADPMPYIAVVGALTGLRRYDEAVARIEARRPADPNNLVHLQLLGDVAIARHDLAAAERSYRAIIAQAPAVPLGYVHTARVLGLRGDGAGALAVLAQGEQAAPDDLEIPLAHAEWLTRERRHDEALALYERLHQRAPDNDTIANNLAFLLADVKGDRASVERALALAGRFAESRHPGYLDSLGWIHHRLGDYDKAVPLLERAVALAPDAPLLQLHLGQALVKRGDAARGKSLLRKALERPSDGPAAAEARALLAQG